MNQSASIYQDMATRTGSSIYIGVVGPVRTGKSTFIKRFMETQVLPNIDDSYRRDRARDELPQSGSGRTIMTAEPKFVPEEAVEVCMEEGVTFSVRLIDCVGYMVPGAVGQYEDLSPRMVMTPWFDHEIPMTEAAELGTRKVICDHSTVGIVVTTDGSVTEIPREDYLEAEERVIRELQELGKPFVVLLNSAQPQSPRAQSIAADIQRQYDVRCLPVNCLELGEPEITELLRGLFYETLSRQSGLTVTDDGDLMQLLTSLAAVRKEYDRMAPAMQAALDTGYGIVMPSVEDLNLEDPEIVRQGGRYSVRMKASAPSVHMIRADIATTVSPIVGNEKQSEDMVNYLLQEFEGDTSKLWQSNIFGRSFNEIVGDDLQAKLRRMPTDSQKKMREALERIINEGSGGLICIIL